MAIITDADVRAYWRDLYRLGRGKEDLKTDALPTALQVKQMVQAIEDFWQAGKAQLFTDMITASGFTTLTAAQARVIGRAWLQRKAEGGNT